jgi:uncharacterized protein HemX
MIEAAVTAGIAALAAMAAVTNRLHGRISSLDNRVDRVELYVAQNYISKAEHSQQMQKLEDHMIRIETKLDAFIQRFPAS